MRLFPRASFLLLCLVALGCGRADGRRALGGRVSIDGQPAAGATISFRPVGHDGNTAGVVVRDGEFHLPADKGLLPGKYAVAVQAYRDSGRTFDDPQFGKVSAVEPAAIKSIDPKEIEVSADRPNEFEIRLTTAH